MLEPVVDDPKSPDVLLAPLDVVLGPLDVVLEPLDVVLGPLDVVPKPAVVLPEPPLPSEVADRLAALVPLLADVVLALGSSSLSPPQPPSQAVSATAAIRAQFDAEQRNSTRRFKHMRASSAKAPNSLKPLGSIVDVPARVCQTLSAKSWRRELPEFLRPVGTW